MIALCSAIWPFDRYYWNSLFFINLQFSINIINKVSSMKLNGLEINQESNFTKSNSHNN